MQCSDKSFQIITFGNICVYQTHHFNDYLSRIITDLVSSDKGTITRFSGQLTRIIRVLLEVMHCPVIYQPEHIKLIRCFAIEVALIPLHITTLFNHNYFKTDLCGGLYPCFNLFVFLIFIC